ncbi:MAG: YicC family protein [Firmicutes bacterium]|nr:YicC family protein [Bacillota bacterium]
MVRSMTGFGRGIYSDEARTIIVEIRAVNHRYCDIFMKMPRRYSFAEEKLKAVIKQHILRGKIEVSVSVENIGAAETDIRLNKELARKYYDALTELKDEFGIDDPIGLSMLTRMPDVITTAAAEEDEEELLGQMTAAMSDACLDICRMREIEGEKLAQDILMRADIIEETVAEISKRAPMLEKEFALKLKDRLEELLENKVEVPEDRILLEAAVFADKANITEEIVRLGSHIHQLRAFMTEEEGSIGKKIDFLVQEMNREANTIGSKSNDKEITSLMLKLKAEIEKIREQVQNIE